MVLLINTAYGLGNTSNNSTAQQDLINSTESDQDITLVQNLIIVDDVQFKSRNELAVSETLIFKNSGTMNFSGALRIWLTDGAEGIKIGRSEMMMEANQTPVIEWKQNGNIISWRGEINANALPPLYTVEYLIPETKGTKQYSKMFLYPTLVTKKPNSIVLKITLDKEERASIKDENGNSISTSGSPREEGNSILYDWETPDFNAINIDISSSPAAPAGITGYVVIGLVVILVFSYPVIRKKNEKIRAFEEKISNSLKRKETAEETAEESREELFEETTTPEPVETEEETGFEGKTREELEAIKDENLSKLSDLKKEYESGNMLDEEFEELKKSYQGRIDKIKRRMEKSD